MDKSTEALKKLFELSRYKKNDVILEKIISNICGQLNDIKFVLKRLFSKRYGGSIEAYIEDIAGKLRGEKGSLDVAMDLNEHTRILREFQANSLDWYNTLEQGSYF